jgi:hypothetical protein
MAAQSVAHRAYARPDSVGALAAGVLITALVITGRSQPQAPGRPALKPPAPPVADSVPISLVPPPRPRQGARMPGHPARTEAA